MTTVRYGHNFRFSWLPFT